jgi:predicted SAM-dependent methyltransferase
MTELIYLNLGSGGVNYEGTTSIDSNPAIKPDIVANVLALPYEDGVVEGIIASHVLEHLPQQLNNKALGEWYRVLRLGGKIVIGVPNLEIACKNFLENTRGKRDFWYQCIYGWRRYIGDEHQQGFTKDMLEDLLLGSGFEHLCWRDVESHNLEVSAIKGELLPVKGA